MKFKQFGAVFGLTALSLAMTHGAFAADKEIIVSANGGKIEKAIRDVIAPRFEKQTGVKVNFIPALSGEILAKVQLQKAHPQMDVAFYVPTDVPRARDRGLLEPLNAKLVPNLTRIDPGYIAEPNTGVPIFGYVIAPAYNTKAFAAGKIAPITSWNDLARKQYNGRTAYTDIGNDWAFTTLVGLANANGGNVSNLNPGFNKAKEMAAVSTTFYKNSTQVMPVLQQGTAIVSVLGSYVTADLVSKGVPLKMAIPKEGVPRQAFTATLVKNAPHRAAALQFINFIAAPDSQKAIADAGFYPVVKGMGVSPLHAAAIGLPKGARVYTPNLAQQAKERAAATDRWNKEVTPELGKAVRK